MLIDSTQRTGEPTVIPLHRLGPGLLAAALSLGLWILAFAIFAGSIPSPTVARLTAAFMSGLAIVATRITIRDLYGQLIVDRNGVELTPRVCGFRLWWSEISMWCLDGEAAAKRSSSFLLWRSGFDTPQRVPVKWFTVSDRERVFQAFQDFGRDKKRRY